MPHGETTPTAAPRRPLTVIQMLPALDGGGVERGTVEVARYLVERGHRSIVISAGGRLRDELLAAGSEHLCWDVGAKRPRTLLWIPRVRALLRETRPDILHLRSRLPAWIGYRAWRGLAPPRRPALVTTVHGFYSVSRYSAVMTRGERVIAIAECVRDYILRNYPRVDPRRIRVIPRGVDPHRYPYGYQPTAAWREQWYRDFPHTRDRFIVTLPGRLTRLKGHADFIAVIAMLKQRGVPVHGLLPGGTHPRKRAYKKELHRQIQAAGLSGDITFPGERGDLRDVMALSDVVLSLSVEPEAFGRTTIEALSLGRPTAGYDHGGVGEQLRALLPEGCVPVGDRQGMAELLLRWREQPPVPPREHPYTLARMLASTLEVYEEARTAHAAGQLHD